MLDEELRGEMAELLDIDLPGDLERVFISSVSGFGLDKLKDIIWKALNDE